MEAVAAKVNRDVAAALATGEGDQGLARDSINDAYSYLIDCRYYTPSPVLVGLAAMVSLQSPYRGRA